MAATPMLGDVRLSARARPDRVSWARFAWVGPLTIVAVLAVNYAVKLLIQLLDPPLAAMGQLQRPLISISVEGATAAVLVFAVVGLLVPRPLFWYRILAIVALLVSFVPDIGLGMGGQARLAVGRVMALPLSLGAPAPSGTGGAPPGLPPALPVDQVLVLLTLHIITAAVCVVLLTTLARPAAPIAQSP